MAYIDCLSNPDTVLTVQILEEFGYQDAKSIHETIVKGGRIECLKTMKWWQESNLRRAIKWNNISFLDHEKLSPEFGHDDGNPLLVRLKSGLSSQQVYTL